MSRKPDRKTVVREVVRVTATTSLAIEICSIFGRIDYPGTVVAIAQLIDRWTV